MTANKFIERVTKIYGEERKNGKVALPPWVESLVREAHKEGVKYGHFLGSKW